MSLLTAKDVSVDWKIPLARVYELTRRGFIPAVRLGDRQLRYDSEVLGEFAKSGSIPTKRIGIEDAANKEAKD